MRRHFMTPIALLASIGIVVAATACSNSGTSATSPQAPTHPASTAPSGSAAASVSPSCAAGWQTAPVTVASNLSVPPVPVATAIRTGSHSDCRFDRIVINLRGGVPGYRVMFVKQVIQDASGQPLSLPGSTYLELRLDPAQGHTSSGAVTITQARTLSYPMLKGFKVAGDFEGVLTVALGLAGGHQYRVGVLPGRIYLDVAW